MKPNKYTEGDYIRLIRHLRHKLSKIQTELSYICEECPLRESYKEEECSIFNIERIIEK